MNWDFCLSLCFKYPLYIFSTKDSMTISSTFLSHITLQCSSLPRCFKTSINQTSVDYNDDIYCPMNKKGASKILMVEGVTTSNLLHLLHHRFLLPLLSYQPPRHIKLVLLVLPLASQSSGWSRMNSKCSRLFFLFPRQLGLVAVPSFLRRAGLLRLEREAASEMEFEQKLMMNLFWLEMNRWQ